MSIREIVVFAVHSTVERGAVERAAKRVEKFLADQPGYQGRELYFDEANGRYVDIVIWKDMTCAKAGAEEAMRSPECAELFAMVRGDTVQMLHAQKIALA